MPKLAMEMPEVDEILDLFYERDGFEPDWAAIREKVHVLEVPKAVLIGVLQTFYLVYEDNAEYLTRVWAHENGLK